MIESAGADTRFRQERIGSPPTNLPRDSRLVSAWLADRIEGTADVGRSGA
jgi:hypothetical protein